MMEMNNLIKEYNERIEQETGVDKEVLSTIWETLQNEMDDEYEYDDDVALREQDLAMRAYARGEEPPSSKSSIPVAELTDAEVMEELKKRLRIQGYQC